MTDRLPEHAAEKRQELTKSLKIELELALMFVQVSSSAYGKGKLQQAMDARSRAEAVQTRAITDFIESSTPDAEAADSLRSMLAEVRHALSRLPFPDEAYSRARRAG
jgi:hypothetical protein